MILKYTFAWLGMMLLAIINGAARDLFYKSLVGELAAHQISTVILLILFGFYFWILKKKWPLQSYRQAWTVGFIWLFLTESFEFGMAALQRSSWEQMAHAYNLMDGQLWILIPIWVLIGPVIVCRTRPA